MVDSLETNVFLTSRTSARSVAELADSLGVGVSWFYRATDPNDAGERFPLALLIPLMQATGDYRILEHLNARCGRVTVRLDRVAKLKRRDARVVNDIQRNFSDVMGAVLSFFENPDRSALPELVAGIQRHLCEVAALKRTVSDFHQQEMF